MMMRELVLVLLVLLGAVHSATAREPEFSYMTLNGITQVAAVAEDIPTDLMALGLKPALFEDRARRALEGAGIKVVPLAEALTAPGAGKLRIRLITNRDGYGIYYFAVKLEMRQKIPLGNPAGGFVSQAVWSDGESGQMLDSEFNKPLSALDRLLVQFIADHQAQNGAAD